MMKRIQMLLITLFLCTGASIPEESLEEYRGKFVRDVCANVKVVLTQFSDTSQTKEYSIPLCFSFGDRIDFGEEDDTLILKGSPTISARLGDMEFPVTVKADDVGYPRYDYPEMEAYIGAFWDQYFAEALATAMGSDFTTVILPSFKSYLLIGMVFRVWEGYKLPVLEGGFGMSTVGTAIDAAQQEWFLEVNASTSSVTLVNGMVIEPGFPKE